MSHPVPGHDYSERSRDESRKEYHNRASKGRALENAKKGGLLGDLKRAVRASKKARSSNWRDLLGK